MESAAPRLAVDIIDRDMAARAQRCGLHSEMRGESFPSRPIPTPTCSMKPLDKRDQLQCSPGQLNGSWHWQWACDEPVGQTRIGYFGCLERGETLCFVGDSLGRQLHVEVACKHGHSHKWWPSNTSGGKRVVAPSHSTLLSGAKLRYSALFCHLTPQLPEDAGHLKAQLSSHFIPASSPAKI